MPNPKIAASLRYIEGVARISTKSRRLAGRKTRSGTETSSETWVTRTNCSGFSRLAARNDSGSWAESMSAVALASRAPRR